MADVKISQLPAATTPVDGTEVLPIVQSATTKQVSIANLTAGRAMSASSLTLTTPLAVTSGGTGLATTAAGTLLSSTALNTISATATPTLGVAGTTAGSLGLSGSSSGVVTLNTAAAAGTWSMTLPTSGGTNGYILTTNGSGVTSWTNPTALGVDLDVGGTAITGATDKYVLYNNNGTLGQYAVTGTGTTVVLSTSPTFTTGFTSPLHIGGTTASSSLTLQSTSGVGTSDSILFKVGNNGATTAGAFDTSGNFGIGTTGPSIYGKLAVVNTSSGAVTTGAVLVNNSANSVGTGVGLYFDPNGAQLARAASIQSVQTTSGNYANLQFFVAGGGAPQQAMTLDTAGNLGIGITGPSAPLHVYNTANSGWGAIVEKSAGSGTPNGLMAVVAQNASNYIFAAAQGSYASPNYKLVVTGAGDLLVGTTSTSENSGAGLKVLNTGGTVASVSGASTSSQSNWEMYSTGVSAFRFYVGWNGKVNATSDTIAAISDQRLKENIRDLDDGLSTLLALKPRKFDWKEGKGENIKNARGFIAQEFGQVFPDLIDEWKDAPPEGEEPYKSVRAALTPVIVKAIQELAAKVSALEAKQ